MNLAGRYTLSDPHQWAKIWTEVVEIGRHCNIGYIDVRHVELYPGRVGDR